MVVIDWLCGKGFGDEDEWDGRMDGIGWVRLEGRRERNTVLGR